MYKSYKYEKSQKTILNLAESLDVRIVKTAWSV